MEHLSVNYYFIVNPNAGTRREQRKLLNSISSGCKASGAEYTLYETSCAGDGGDFMLRTASEQLSACSGDPEKMPQLRFYFAGGDGTVLESANAFMKLPEDQLRAMAATKNPEKLLNQYIKESAKHMKQANDRAIRQAEKARQNAPANPNPKAGK